MKTLLLMRHAKSSWDDTSLPDHERPLNHRGRRDAPRMRKFIKKTKHLPQRVVTSSAVRARSTAELVVKSFDDDIPVVVTEALYHAFPEKMLDVIHQQPCDVDVLLLVGHNPGMESLVALLLDRDEKMPTAAIASFDYDIAQWSDLSVSTRCKSSAIWRPKEID
ncbi:MAG: histidine phosphatase family protein [Planctomycetota bacterium]|nr:histidine phosphatase family protein [Planctomycetota bacterium]